MVSLLPGIATVATIIASSLAGAISLLILRAAYQRRVLIAALHNEMIDNYLHLLILENNVDMYPENPEQVFLNEEFRTGAIEALRLNDPLAYLSLEKDAESITPSYMQLDNLEAYGDARLQADPEVVIDLGGIQRDNPDSEEETIYDYLDGIQEIQVNAILELESYISSSLLRKCLHYNSIYNLSELDIDEDDPVVEAS